MKWRRVVLSSVLLGVLAAACTSTDSTGSRSSTSTAATTGAASTEVAVSSTKSMGSVASVHPCRTTATTTGYGAFIPRVANGTARASSQDVLAEAAALHVRVLRTEQDVTSATPAPERAAFEHAGIETVLTVRDDPTPDPEGHPTVYPPNTPEKLARFRTDLEATLRADPPCLVAVENEEVGSPFVSGTPADYLGELSAAIEVGHRLGIPVTNGGIVSGVTALLTWHDLFATAGKAAADDFAGRAFPEQWQKKLRASLLASSDGALPPGPTADKLAAGLQLVSAYRTLPLDYVNFHWYIDDDQALTQAVTYLRKATGKPVITHEIGQYRVDPAVVTGHLRALDALGVPIVIWFDGDGDPAVGLHDTPGRLRSNGAAFAAYVTTH